MKGSYDLKNIMLTMEPHIKTLCNCSEAVNLLTSSANWNDVQKQMSSECSQSPIK